MLNVAIIGSTGSIGTQAIEVIKNFPQQLRVRALAANTNWETLSAQVSASGAAEYACNSPETPAKHGGAVKSSLAELVNGGEIDIFLFACIGVDNLPHLKAALSAERTKRVLLANKELLVIAGADLMRLAGERSAAKLIPVDSEPTAIWQIMQGEDAAAIDKVVLTASGGAFRGRKWSSLAGVTAKEALAHPTWQMGPKITVDSATLVNKAYEVAEIHWYFGVSYAQIEVVIHPSSFIHGMVQFVDGTCKMLAGPPDMRYSIQYALLPDERLANQHYMRGWNVLDYPSQTFEAVELENYPCFQLALSCLQQGAGSGNASGADGGDSTAIAKFIGANRAAVEAFCNGEIKFPAIYDILKGAVSSAPAASSGAPAASSARPEEIAEAVYESTRKAYL